MLITFSTNSCEYNVNTFLSMRNTLFDTYWASTGGRVGVFLLFCFVLFSWCVSLTVHSHSEVKYIQKLTFQRRNIR